MSARGEGKGTPWWEDVRPFTSETVGRISEALEEMSSATDCPPPPPPPPNRPSIVEVSAPPHGEPRRSWWQTRRGEVNP